MLPPILHTFLNFMHLRHEVLGQKRRQPPSLPSPKCATGTQQLDAIVHKTQLYEVITAGKMWNAYTN